MRGFIHSETSWRSADCDRVFGAIWPLRARSLLSKSGKPPPLVPVRADDRASSYVVVKVEAGVIADVHTCDGTWCRVTIDDYSGYIEQKKLWGVYEGEKIK